MTVHSDHPAQPVITPRPEATPVASCCSATEQSTCCAPAEKSSCCGAEATAGGGCGCR